ncbi:hypothetical protein CHS0354_038042 [Potamilus streckersoni]|uniref:Denticleless protein homolog n=1 Tax=Potamilus streckersoni TaxID=2493646 RepID=A0AAE0SSF5_9BIVA|nr:hypothetical protein CHS0354_038042 [Potamilus streckersoni]
MPFFYSHKRELGYLHFNCLPGVKPQLSSHILESLRCSQSETYCIGDFEEEITTVPFSCSFCKVSSLSDQLGVVDEDGYVILYDTNKTGKDALITEWKGHDNAIFDLAWLEKEEKLLTASGDQTVVLWDVENTKLDTFKGHTGTVRSVCLLKENNAVFATGSRDGNIFVWDTRCNKKDKFTSAVNTIKNAHILPSQSIKQQILAKRRTKHVPVPHGITSVIFQNDHLLASAGAVDGCIKMWDIRKIYTRKVEPEPVYFFPYPGTCKRNRGYSHLSFDSTYTRLFASCTDDIIYMYDLAAYNPVPVCHFRGHKNETFYVKTALSPDNQFLLSGSTDELAYIWQIGKPSQSPVVLKGHKSEVTGVAWSSYDFFKLVTMSDDSSVRIWRYNPSIAEEQAMDTSLVSGIAERTDQSSGTSAISDVETVVPVSPDVNICTSTPQLSKIKPSYSSLVNTPKVCEKEVHREITSIVHGVGTSNSSSRSIRGWLLATQSEVMPESKNIILIKKTNTEKRDIILENADVENIEPKRKHFCERKFMLEEESPSNRQCVLASLDSEINSSPEKSPKGKRRAGFSSPIHISKLNIHAKNVSSPTANLPNLMFDPKPLKQVKDEDCKEKPKVNWLTHLSQQKRRLVEEKKISLLQGPNHVLESPQSQASTATVSTLSSSDISSQESLSRSEISSPRAKIKSPPKGTRPVTHFFQRRDRSSS